LNPVCGLETGFKPVTSRANNSLRRNQRSDYF